MSAVLPGGVKVFPAGVLGVAEGLRAAGGREAVHSFAWPGEPCWQGRQHVPGLCPGGPDSGGGMFRRRDFE